MAWAREIEAQGRVLERAQWSVSLWRERRWREAGKDVPQEELIKRLWIILLIRLWGLNLVEDNVVVVAGVTAIVVAMWMAAVVPVEEVEVVTLPGNPAQEEERLWGLLQSSQEILMEVDQCKTSASCDVCII